MHRPFRPLALVLVVLVVGSAGCGARTDLSVARSDASAPEASRDAAAPARVVQLVAGYGFSCALESSGTVLCWGYNASAALGDGTTESRAEPRPVLGVTDATSIVAADHRVCAVRADGSILCWGARFEESAPDRILERRAVPETGLSGIVGLAVVAAHACAIDADRRLWCWGYGGNGALGGGVRPFTAEPIRIEGLEGVRAVAGGEGFTCALDRTRVSCWGVPVWLSGAPPTPEMLVTAPRAVEGTEGATDLVAGYGHACVIGAAGEALCWGNDFEGMAGVDPARVSYVHEPTRVMGLDDVEQLDAGLAASCARTRGGRMACWGLNSFGQLGAPTPDRSETPLFIPGLDDVVTMATGEYHDCALRRSGEVVCWGDGAYGQLGPARPSGRSSTPVVVIPAP